MIELVPLKCVRCETPIPASLDEIAWVCERCGQGMILLDERGLTPLTVNYAAGIQPGLKGSPYWVAGGNLQLNRQTYASFSKKDNESAEFWSQPRRFFVPAFACELETTIHLGAGLLRNPPRLTPGQPVPFAPVTVAPTDMMPLAEFIVMAMEAERKDSIKEIQFSLQLSSPELWVLP